MKKINFKILQIFILAVIILVAGCKKNDLLIDVNEPSHRVIFTSEMDFENTIEINTTMSFGDISAGVKSREWTFPNDGVDIVDADNDQTSTEARVTALFTKVGQFEVKLHQVFDEDVFADGALQGATEMDTIILVTVLDEIEVSVVANYLNADGTLGAELNIADMAKNPIPASESVRFTFNGLGEPEFIRWNMDGGSPGTYVGRETTLDVKYKFLGTFDLEVIGTRSRPFGGDTLLLTDFIEVQPSTAPVVVDRLTDKDGNIAIEFNREVDPATLNASDFSVTIQNDFTVMPSFNSVTIDADEGNIVVIELAGEDIYNDDTIKVTYQGSLFSLDGIQADNFVDQELVFNKVNIFEMNSSVDYSFENSTDLNWPSAGWADPFDYYDIAISSDQAYDGLNSMLVNLPANESMAINHVDQNGDRVTFPVSTTKTYEMGVWVYVEALGDPSVGLSPDLRIYWDPDIDFGIGGNPSFGVDFPLNEWIYSKAFVTFAAATGPQTPVLRAFNGSNPQAIKYYVDNMSLSEVTLRP
jgi:hypothetical protein